MKYNDYKKKVVINNTFPVRHADTFSLLVEDFIKNKEFFNNKITDKLYSINETNDVFQQDFYLNGPYNSPMHFTNLRDFILRGIENPRPKDKIILSNAHPWGISYAKNQENPNCAYFKIILYIFLKKIADDPTLFKMMINYKGVYVSQYSVPFIDQNVPTSVKTTRYDNYYSNITGKMFTFIVKTLLKPEYREFLKTLTAKDPHFIKLISRAEKEKYYPLYRYGIIADHVKIIEEYVPDYSQLRPGIDFRPPLPPQGPPRDHRID